MSTESRRAGGGRSPGLRAAAQDRGLLVVLLLVVGIPTLQLPPSFASAQGVERVSEAQDRSSSLVARAAFANDPAPEPRLRLADLDGRWRPIDDPAATQARLIAIDSAVEPLTWVVRKMATGVLRSSTAPRPTLDFVWDGNRLHERVPGQHRIEIRVIEPGAPAFQAKDPRGESFEGAWDWTPEGLRLRWRQPQAHGSNLYRISPDKRTLSVDHTIQVTALSGLRPIVYRSNFAKDDLPAVASDAPAPEP